MICKFRCFYHFVISSILFKFLHKTDLEVNIKKYCQLFEHIRIWCLSICMLKLSNVNKNASKYYDINFKVKHQRTGFSLTNDLPSIFWHSSSSRTAGRDGRKPTWSLSITASWKSKIQTVKTVTVSCMFDCYITIYWCTKLAQKVSKCLKIQRNKCK